MTANISPLSQTFKVDETLKEGCFITSVDLYFSIVGNSEPVECQIVETLNGYPTDNVLQGAKSIVQPNELNGSSTSLVPTKFKFEDLIYLTPNTEYAIKVISNSDTHEVWTSILGEPRIDNPSVLITKQPTLGSLFKSQNNSTWTPEQTQDLTFSLNRAKFDTSAPGNLKLNNTTTATYITLPPNPFNTTNGSTTVKVDQPNHGLNTGMSVTFSGSDVVEFNNTFTIVSTLSSDEYTITSVAQTATNFVGGQKVKTEENVKYDSIIVTGVGEGKDANANISITLASDTVVDSKSYNVKHNELLDLSINKYVHNSINRTNILSGKSSFTLDATLNSSNHAVSPTINLDSFKVRLLGNKINNPSINDIDLNLDGATITTASCTFNTDNTITLPPNTINKIKQGAWIKITSGTLNINKTGYISTIDTTNNVITLVGDSLASETVASTIVQYTSYISETANGGSAESKTITKKVNLINPASGFRVLVDLNVHTDAEIEMYYRTGMQSDSKQLNDTTWTNEIISYKKSANEKEFLEYEFNITDLEIFDTFQFKFVLLSDNAAVTPKIKNLRIIAHA